MCPACGEERRIWIHAQKERHLRCRTCHRTFTETHGSPLFRPRYLVIVVLSLLAHGCPVQVIVFSFGLDKRTVSTWRERVGRHTQRVHERVVCQGQIEPTQIQADERCVTMQRGTVWIATAVCVFSRLFIWGEVDARRNTGLVQRVVEPVWMALERSGTLLWVTDGFGAWAKVVAKVFRDPIRTGKRGRPRLQRWPQLSFVQVIKHKADKRLISISHRLLHCSWEAARRRLVCSQTQLGRFNTAYVERLNASCVQWLPALTRRFRTPARCQDRLRTALFQTGCVYLEFGLFEGELEHGGNFV